MKRTFLLSMSAALLTIAALWWAHQKKQQTDICNPYEYDWRK